MSGTILFGDDGSTAADLAWAWLNAQDWDGWTVDVLEADPGHASEVSDDIVEWEPELPRVLINPAAIAAVRHLHTRADPRVAIAECADRDVIVVGPRGRGLLKALHLGSTSEWLLHNPPAPLVIARHGQPVRSAVVCSDGSPDSIAAARVLATMPWLPGVDVTVISVPQGELDAEEAVRVAAAELHGKAKSVRQLVLNPDSTEVFYHVRDIILDFLSEHRTDLVVQGTTGLSAWKSLRAGSIASSLAAHATSSVLIVHDRTALPDSAAPS